MYVIPIIGRKKAGKTTAAARLVKEIGAAHNYIYDVVDQYTTEFGIVNDYKGALDPESFLNTVKNVRNSTIVFEEASSYMRKAKLGDDFMKILSQSRHYNNVTILIYHSLGMLHPDIYSLSDFCVLFKTLDYQSALDSRYRKNEQFLQHYYRVNKHPDKHYCEMFEQLSG